MDYSAKSVKLGDDLRGCDISEDIGEMSKPSNFHSVSTFKNRLLSSNQESTESKIFGGSTELEKKSSFKEKSKEEKSSEKKALTPTRANSNSQNNNKKNSPNVNTKQASHPGKKYDRDFRRFRAKYNASIGNITRDWMSLIYTILILRMNLIKLILERLSEGGIGDTHLQKQTLLESKIVYNMIKEAQNYSQKKFMYMWMELEKLIMNRMTLKNALETIQMKDAGLRDWRTAAAKLAQLEEENKKGQIEYKAIQRSKNEVENTVKENLSKLESVFHSKSAEYERLVGQIMELKKREAEMRGKILLNMKSYKDLKTKRQNLLNMESEMSQLKKDQNELIKTYSAKIQSLKNQIEETEKRITMEKEEKRKIRANLENFGNFSEKSTDSLKESKSNFP